MLFVSQSLSRVETKKKKEPIAILKNGFKTIERKRNKKENKKLTILREYSPIQVWILKTMIHMHQRLHNLYVLYLQFKFKFKGVKNYQKVSNIIRELPIRTNSRKNLTKD
jgi:hypothetical protein